MEPSKIAFFCMIAISGIAGFMHLMRKNPTIRAQEMHKKSKRKALKNELSCLHKMLKQILSYKRFNQHERSGIQNLEAITYLDNRINEIFCKKIKIIENYSSILNKEFIAFIQDTLSKEKKAIHHELNVENDKIIASLDKDIIQLQARRALQWNTQVELRDYLEEQEISRNNYINSMYRRYRALLEKIYINIQHDSDSNILPKDFFKPSLIADFGHINMEKNHRVNVINLEFLINNNALTSAKNSEIINQQDYYHEHA